MKVERISAVTLRVANVRNSVRFYRDVLGMEIIYGERRWMFFFAPGQGRQRSDPEFRAGSSSYSVGRMILRGGR
jgi:catechol 2,3-dioxygenase-like lactoylglutathione lyase family enzyme